MINSLHLDEVKKRQENFLQAIGERFVIIVSGYEKVRNNDVYYPFRQESMFNYLTAFPEPDSVAIFDGRENSYSLFVRKNDQFMELWNGKRLGVQGALRYFGADEAYTINQLEEELLKISDREAVLFCEKNHPLEERLLTLMADQLNEDGYREIHSLLINMRMIKSSWEIDNMRRAAEISSRAHEAVRERALTATNEYELQAEFQYECAKHGATSMAYPAIVASGNNATCLHYMSNNSPLNKSDLLLIDAGCEINGYASDITRTFPLSGHFTPVQKDCYEVVLNAQTKALSLIKPGLTLAEIHAVAVEQISRGLQELGLLRGSLEACIENKDYSRYFPHGTSHWLGLDVHDVGGAQDISLEEGMCFTVEPGIYFQDYYDDIPGEFRGIGIRIEDNVCIKSDGVELLTESCPK